VIDEFDYFKVILIDLGYAKTDKQVSSVVKGTKLFFPKELK